jgi:hypothetical protein
MLFLDSAGIKEREDVRVVQLCGDPDLAKEALGADGGGYLGAQHLERHQTIVL